MVIRVKPDTIGEHKKLHANPWPGSIAIIQAFNIRIDSIYHKGDHLYSYFEYCGDDFAQHMAKMAADPVTQQWWALTEPCQEPVDDRQPGEWWAGMEEVFHCD